ncbi:MAG: hypothetical protein WC657_09060 [Candidatus Paceibacterota bacterium]|jgi:hypothetical protein
MENQTVTHQTINGKYRMVIERAASTKGVLGYKVETNGDNLADVVCDIKTAMNEVERIASEGKVA